MQLKEICSCGFSEIFLSRRSNDTMLRKVFRLSENNDQGRGGSDAGGGPEEREEGVVLVQSEAKVVVDRFARKDVPIFQGKVLIFAIGVIALEKFYDFVAKTIAQSS